MLEIEAIYGAVRGGRVSHTPFLDPEEAGALAARLRERGLNTSLDGGYDGARRRVVTVFGDELPHASTPLAAVYYDDLHDEGVLRASLRAQGLDAGEIGDVVQHQDGMSVIVLKSRLAGALALRRAGGRDVTPQEVPLAHLAQGKKAKQQVIVPSLRVDALGAKAFKVSRAYFSKGIAGGKVSVNGKPAGKSAAAEAGDEIHAEGLGRFTIESVEGETRRGNLKVTLAVERMR